MIRTILALIREGVEALSFIQTHKLYSVMFHRRRAGNSRGTPFRAAMAWALLEEARISTEDFFNRDIRQPNHPLRTLLHNMLGECSNKVYIIYIKLSRVIPGSRSDLSSNQC